MNWTDDRAICVYWDGTFQIARDFDRMYRESNNRHCNLVNTWKAAAPRVLKLAISEAGKPDSFFGPGRGQRRLKEVLTAAGLTSTEDIHKIKSLFVCVF